MTAGLFGMAERLAARCGVVPLHVDNGYRPRLAFAEALRTPVDVRDWYAKHPRDGIGIVADVAKLVVIDIEDVAKNGEDGRASLAAAEAELGELPPTRTHATKSGGEHRVYRCAAPLRSAQGELRGAMMPVAGVDIVAGHALLRWPPTTGYTVLHDLPCADLPAAWVTALGEPPDEPTVQGVPVAMRYERATKYAAAALSREAEQIASLGAMRNCELVRAAFRLGQLCPPLTAKTIEVTLLGAAEANGEIGDHGKRSVLGTIRRGMRAGSKTPRSAPT